MEITIPALPCKSITDTVNFYRVLGFEIPYEQVKPNPYAIVRRGGIEIHFFALRDYDPAQSYSTCIVSVPDAQKLYEEFRTALKHHYGRILTVGIPRMTRLRVNSEDHLAFTVIDPGGNWIRFFEATKREHEAVKSTALSRAIHAAEFLRDSKGDEAAAAESLDKALAKADAGTPAQRVQALIIRAGLAITMNDGPMARQCLSEIESLPLSDDDRAAFDDLTLHLSTNPLSSK